MTTTPDRAVVDPDTQKITAQAADGSTMFTLTTQQIRVIRLLAEGLSNREIGDRLWLAEDTIKSQLVRLMRIMGARTRAHVVHLAHLGSLLGVSAPIVGPDLSPSALEHSYGDRHLASCALFAIRYCDCSERLRRQRGGRR